MSGFSSTVIIVTDGSIFGGSGIWIWYLLRSTPTRIPSSMSAGATRSPSATTNLAICFTLITYLASSVFGAMILVQRATCSGCSSCIICLSETRSHCEGGARPVSSSFTPTSSWIFLFRSLMSFCAASIDLLYGPTPYVLRRAMSPSSSARDRLLVLVLLGLVVGAAGRAAGPACRCAARGGERGGDGDGRERRASARDRQKCARISSDLRRGQPQDLPSRRRRRRARRFTIAHQNAPPHSPPPWTASARTPLGKALKKEALKTLRRAKYEMKRLRSARLHFSGAARRAELHDRQAARRGRGTRRSGASTSASPTARRCGTP